MKYLNVANPYPPYQEVDVTNLLITGLFISVIILILIFKLYEWNRKRTRYIEHRTKEGWSMRLPFYRVYCPIHGYYEDSPSGYDHILRCPKCISERDEENEES